MTIAKQSLLEAAKAVLNASARNHLRKHHLDALRQAVQDADVYTPMTDDEVERLPLYCLLEDQSVSVRKVERAVIERWGMRWPTPPAPDKP